jgi:hypothetical protein
MDQNSMVRSVVRFLQNGRSRRDVRLQRPQLETLEVREVLAASIVSVSPLDGTVLSSNTTTLSVTYSENVLGANNVNNYILRDSSGNRIPLAGVDYNNVTFTATFSIPQVNNGFPLPLDTYTLFVRGDQITDLNGTPLANPNRLIVSSGGQRTVTAVDIGSMGGLEAYLTLQIDSGNAAAAEPYALASGDLNGDGIDDLVVVNGGNDTANVFFGRAGSNGISFGDKPDLTLLLPIGALGPVKDVVIADFNNDGRNDIAVMNNFFDSITVFTNLGEGTGSLVFSQPNTFFGLIDPREMAVADFDGDGFLDIAVVNAITFLGSYDVTIFQNNQDTQAPNFLPFQDFSVGDDFSGVQVPVSITYGDFNNDGRLDIAVAGDGIRILFNESTPGNLAFTAGPLLSTAEFTSIAAARVDNNNSLDLVAVSTTGDLVTFLNLGNGNFVQRSTPNAVPAAGRLKVGDLNNDGRDELVVTGGTAGNQVSVLTTTPRFGALTFLTVSGTIQVSSPGHGLVTGDRIVIAGVTGQTGLNGTWTVTVLTSDTFSLQGSIGDGTAASPGTWALTRTISGASNPATGPIVITSAGHRLTDGTRITVTGVAGNTAANGTWTVRVLSASTFELVGSTANGIYGGGGTWVVAGPVGVTTTRTVGDTPIGLTLLDADNDGFLDVATANLGSDTVTIVPGTGDRGLVSPDANQLIQANTTAVAYGDLNGDGIEDIVAISTNPANAASRVSVLLGNADGTFQEAFDYAPVSGGTFNNLSSVILADVTGDGNLDIVVTGRGTAGNDGVAILRNNITTPTLQANSFLLGASLRTGDRPTGVVAGDFTGDGNIDLAVSHNLEGGLANSTRRGVTFLRGLGNGFFANGVEIADAQGFAATALVALDYNRDGNLDLAVVDNSLPGQMLLLRGQGNGVFRSGGIFQTNVSSPSAIAVGDFNNDGFDDLVVATGVSGSNSGGIAVLLNEQGTTFTPGIRPPIAPSGAIAGIAVGDLNSDGLLDVVVSGAFGTSNSDLANVFVFAGKGDGTFADPTPYRTNDVSVNPIAPSRIALGDSPLLRLVTFRTGGTQIIENLVANGDFEESDLQRNKGNLTGWQTFKQDSGFLGGSAGGFGPQMGPTSPLSGVGVLPPLGSYQAMLDQPDILPFFPGETNPNPASSYSGSHALYQDIFIPANVISANLSLRLYLQSSGAWSNTAGNPSLDYTVAGANQQVRVDIVRTSASPLSVTASDVLLNVYRTTSGEDATQVVHLSGVNLAAFAGQTIRLRIAAANNQGKLIVGVDDVRVTTTLNDLVAPTISNVRLRTPATNTVGMPLTTDPTLLGRVADNGSVNNIAYIEFDPRNAGFQPGTTFRTTNIDAAGNFSFTFPNLAFGRYTMGVRVVDKAGNASTTTFAFEYQTLFTNEWQAIGPTGIQVADPNLGYSAVSGRITAIETDPSDPSGNTYYIGSVSGGVWRTTDGGSSWTPLMNNVIANNQRIVGAIGAIAVAPSAPRTIYAGLGVADLLPDSRTGSGILKSTNGGQTWTLAGNSATVFADARISKIVVDPNNANLVYVGVASGGQFGPGVYRSANGGNTWVNVMTPAVMNLAGGGTASGPLASVTDLVIDRFNGNRLLVGLGNVGLVPNSATAGVWLSTNGGNSWAQQVGGDGGIVNSDIPFGTDVGTVKVAIGSGRSGDERFVYVLMGTPPGDNTPPSRELGGFLGLFKSSNNMANFTQVMLRQDVIPGPFFDFQDINLGVETSYAASLAIDPSNPNVVFVGGSRKLDPTNPLTHSLIRVDTGNMVDASFGFLNNGNDILKESFGSEEGVYWYNIEQAASGGTGAASLLPPTITHLRFDSQGRLLIGTDGGIWSGTSLGFGYDFSSGGNGLLRNSAGPVGGMSLTAINGNLQITSVTSSASDPTQFGRTYATAIASGQSVTNQPLGFSAQDLSRSLVGTYDAGVIRAATPNPNAGPDTPTTLYRVWKYDDTGVLRPELSTDNGQTWTVANQISITGSEAGFFPVLEINPRKISSGSAFFDEVLFATNRVYQTRTSGQVWDVISPVLTTNGTITAVGIAPVSTNGFYYVGTSDGQLFVAPTGGGLGIGDWLNRSTGLPIGRPITGITVAANNPNVAFVTVGDALRGGRIYRTNNAGQTWINVTNNLPVGNVHDILLDNRPGLNAPAGKVYAATDAGVFVMPMGTSTWFRVGTMPNAPVVDLSIDTTNNILSAAVQGRGVYQLSIGAISPIADQVIDEDTVLGPIRFTLNSLGITNPTLNVFATSSNQSVVRNGAITIGGAGFNRTLTIRPVPEASGETTITLRVNDGVRVFTTSFLLTVNEVNDPPTITPISNQPLSINQPSNVLPFTIGDVDDPVDQLVVTAFSDNQALIPDANIVLGGTGANRTIQFTPEVNTSGTARITIQVTDPRGGVGIRTFDVVVVNTAGLPFADDFDRPNNTFLGDVWSSPVGNFSVGNASAVSDARLSLAILNGASEVNVSVSADIALPARSGQFATLVARYNGVGDRNMYIGGIQALANGNFNAVIFRNVNGVWTQLVSRPVASGTGLLQFEVIDNSLKVFLNGQVVAFAFDNALSTGGSVGLRSNGAIGTRFDNFNAQTVFDNPPAIPFNDDFSAPVNGQLDPTLWRERAGNFALNGSIAQAAASGASIAILNPTFTVFSDVTVQADVNLGTGAFAGVIARASANGRNFYMAGIVRTATGFQAGIWRVVNGVATQLTSANVASGSGQVTFTLSGTSLEMSLNGNPLLSVFDGVLSNPGSAGIRGVGASQFDNFFFSV